MSNPMFYIMNPTAHEAKTPEDIKAFVETYEPIYFLPESEDVAKNTMNFFGVSQSRRWIEEDMESLLGIRTPKKESWTQSDVIHMLAWKMGRINHKESINGVYKYTGNDEKQDPAKLSWSDGINCGYLKANNRSGDIEHISEFVDRVRELKNGVINNELHRSPREMLEAIQGTLQIGTKNEVRGIGSVYLITMLYFVSGGEYPIYDQFAAMALDAIKNGKKPGSTIQIKDLPDKKSKSFLNLLDNPNSVYSSYIKNLEELSELFYGNKDGYQNDRRLDRALWVYGHLFN